MPTLRYRKTAVLSGQHGSWPPRRCATANAGNQPVIPLLPGRGAVRDDHHLSRPGFAEDAHQSLRLQLGHGINRADCTALAAPAGTATSKGGCYRRPALTRTGPCIYTGPAMYCQ